MCVEGSAVHKHLAKQTFCLYPTEVHSQKHNIVECLFGNEFGKINSAKFVKLNPTKHLFTVESQKFQQKFTPD